MFAGRGQKSTNRLTSRALTAVLRKKESKSEYWPRLTKEKLKTPFIKTNFDRWVDEDEQDGKPVDEDFDAGGGGGGGFPGMGSDFDMSKVFISHATPQSLINPRFSFPVTLVLVPVWTQKREMMSSKKRPTMMVPHLLRSPNQSSNGQGWKILVAQTMYHVNYLHPEETSCSCGRETRKYLRWPIGKVKHVIKMIGILRI